MLRGTKSLNRQQIQDALDKNFVRLGTGGNMRMMRGAGAGGGVGTITFTIETKRANLPAAFDILRQVLREPSLPGSEFEVMKNEQIAGIEQGRSDPMRRVLTTSSVLCRIILPTTSATCRLSMNKWNGSRRPHSTRLPRFTAITWAPITASS